MLQTDLDEKNSKFMWRGLDDATTSKLAQNTRVPDKGDKKSFEPQRMRTFVISFNGDKNDSQSFNLRNIYTEGIEMTRLEALNIINQGTVNADRMKEEMEIKK